MVGLPLASESSESSALERAASDRRPLLVDFGASWCGARKELEADTFPDPRVRAEGARFVALHIDATDDDPEVARLRKKYGALEGLPVRLPSTAPGKRSSGSPNSSLPSNSHGRWPPSGER